MEVVVAFRKVGDLVAATGHRPRKAASLVLALLLAGGLGAQGLHFSLAPSLSIPLGPRSDLLRSEPSLFTESIGAEASLGYEILPAVDLRLTLGYIRLALFASANDLSVGQTRSTMGLDARFPLGTRLSALVFGQAGAYLTTMGEWRTSANPILECGAGLVRELDWGCSLEFSAAFSYSFLGMDGWEPLLYALRLGAGLGFSIR